MIFFSELCRVLCLLLCARRAICALIRCSEVCLVLQDQSISDQNLLRCWKKLADHLSRALNFDCTSTMDLSSSIINNKWWDICIFYLYDLNNLLQGRGKQERRSEVCSVLALIGNLINNVKIRLVIPFQPPFKSIASQLPTHYMMQLFASK